MDEKELQLLVETERAKARKEHGVQIRFIKEQVGQGEEFTNGLVRVVISPRGIYSEFIQMPEEMTGFLGDVSYELIDNSKGIEYAEEILAIINQVSSENTRLIQFVCIFPGPVNGKNAFVYVYDARTTNLGQRKEGFFQHGIVPVYFSIRAESELFLPKFCDRKILAFFAGYLHECEQNLWVCVQLSRKGTEDMNDQSATMH